MMYKSQFKKIDPNDGFVVQGHIFDYYMIDITWLSSSCNSKSPLLYMHLKTIFKIKIY